MPTLSTTNIDRPSPKWATYLVFIWLIAISPTLPEFITGMEFSDKTEHRLLKLNSYMDSVFTILWALSGKKKPGPGATLDDLTKQV